MATDPDAGEWADLLHSSTKLLEQAAPSAQFPPLQRNLDQLEALSKKLKAKTLLAEAPRQSTSATRLLAREGLSAEQLARDLKTFKLKTTYEDVFPAEATTVEEYLQQVHEMAMVSAIQEALKDNLRSFNDYMLHALEEDWKKEKREYLHNFSRLALLPRRESGAPSSGLTQPGQITSNALSPQLSRRSSVDHVPGMDRPISDRKTSVYAEVVRNLNDSRQSGLPFKPATAFRAAHDRLGAEYSVGKTVSIQKIWHLIHTVTNEDSGTQQKVCRRMSLVIGARRHLEFGHEKYILETIQSHPAQAALGGGVGNLQKIHAFLRVRLRDHGVLDFDSIDARKQPPIDTTWQQIYYCLRTGYYDEAKYVAQSSRVAYQFTPMLAEWITTGGMVSHETALLASEECDKILRISDRAGRPGYDRKKLLLYAIISGCDRQIDRLLRDIQSLFSTIEDFLWFTLSCVRDVPSTAPSLVLNNRFVPYTLQDLQTYLNKFESSYYTKNGKDPLVYPYVLLLSIQFLPAILYLTKESGEEGYSVDAIHISIALADHGVLPEGSGVGHKSAVMDACGEVGSIIRHYGSIFLRHGDLRLALEYYVQAAAAMGGGHVSWTGQGTKDQQRQRSMMLKQLLSEVLLWNGGISLLLGSKGTGEEGLLQRYLPDEQSRQQFLIETGMLCQETGLHEKSVEIQKRVGAFVCALETINKCLSEAICALSRGRLDSESRITGLIHSGNEVIEAYKYSTESSLQDKESMSEKKTVLRQLEAILSILKLVRSNEYVDALREVTKLSFLPLDPRRPDRGLDVFQNLSPHVQECVPDLLKAVLHCLDNVRDTDGTLRAMKAKVSSFVASNMARNWPQDLYEKVARSL
ncbi:nuclear pore complex protein NUP93A-like [Wolffia australiana]